MSDELKTAVKLAKAHRLAFDSIMIATFTFFLDFIFHQSFTYPMEIPTYFAMKFFSALVIAFFLVPRIGAIKSALVFTLWVDLYYAVFVVLLMIPNLSSSPTQIISILGNTNQLVLLPAWTLAHGFFFWFAVYVTRRIEL